MTDNSEIKRDKAFRIVARLRSFTYAWHGLRLLVTREHNARIHAAATIVVVVMGFAFHLSIAEWVQIALCIGFVWSAEAVNSALERVVDLIEPKKNPLAKAAKDLAAGGVLIAAITSIIVGLLMFAPKMMDLLSAP